MKKLICFFYGHSFCFNFSTLPNKSICKRCGKKYKLNTKTLEWSVVEKFENETRTDKQLAKTWHFVK